MFYLRCFTPLVVWLSEDDVICLFGGWMRDFFLFLQIKRNKHEPVYWRINKAVIL